MVAGGLGERLGYSGIKLELPPEITYDGEESDESGFSSDEEDDDDLSSLTYKELQKKLTNMERAFA